MDAPTPRTLILAALDAAVLAVNEDTRTCSTSDRARAISRYEQLRDLRRRVERGDIGDLTRTRAAEQAAFAEGVRLMRRAARKVAAREASAWEGIEKPDGAHAARAIEDAIGDVPMPERGT